MSVYTNIQGAIFTKLSTLATPVYDEVPQNTPPAFIVTGDLNMNEYDGDDFTGFDGTIQIDTFTTYRGKKQCADIMSGIYDALHRSELTITGYTWLGIDCEYSDIIRESDGLTRHGVQRFRFKLTKG